MRAEVMPHGPEPVRRLAVVTVPAHAQRQQLPALTGLRFLIALLVVLYHITINGGVLFVPLTTIGYVGVNCFFILSGFVLTYTYVTGTGHLRTTRRAFWAARIARVYPVYLFSLVVAIPPLLWAYGGSRSMAVILGSSLTLTQAWFPPLADAWNGPGWSLSDEAFFYLLFPMLVLPIARVPRRVWNVAANLCWLLALAAALVYIVWNPDRLSTWGFTDSTAVRVLRFLPLIHLPEFLLGCLLARMFCAQELSRKDRPSRKSSAAGSAAVPALALLLVVPVIFPIPYVLASDGILDPLFALLIYGLASGQGLMARLLSTRLLVVLGEASYALYLLHIPLYGWLQHWLAGPTTGFERPLFWCAYVLLSISCSVLTLRLLEQPARKWLRGALAAG